MLFEEVLDTDVPPIEKFVKTIPRSNDMVNLLSHGVAQQTRTYGLGHQINTFCLFCHEDLADL